MKRSYQLLLLSIVILFATTSAYDLAIKREYSRIDYIGKGPYSDYDQLNFANFDKVEIRSSNRISTSIIYSEKFDVKRLKQKENARIEQNGTTLVIVFNEESQNYSGGNDIIIKCPSLKSISSTAGVSSAEATAVSIAKFGQYFGGRISVNGFKQDSLDVIIKNSNSITLQNNKLDFLNAKIGTPELINSIINIDGTNKISSANMILQRRSIMNLNNIEIKNLKYKLSDSATINLSGISLRLLSNK